MKGKTENIQGGKVYTEVKVGGKQKGKEKKGRVSQNGIESLYEKLLKAN